ncbi:MAG TPA: type II secretion system F family protein [Tepidiformaceae bacterium]|nr:type II secretion system F family protein [Tepidiformaceae bacterium]
MQLVLIGALAFGAVMLFTVYAASGATARREAVRVRLGGGAISSAPLPQAVALRRQQSRIPFVDMLPLSEESRRKMAAELERAGQPLRVNEYLGIRMAAAVVGAVGAGIVIKVTGLPGWAAVLAALLGMVAGWLLPPWYVRRSCARRLIAIEEQLPDALTAISKSLRAGTGLLQALAHAADEVGAPLGSELQGTLRDLQLGADAEVVFTRLSERVGSPDLDIAVTAILIQRTVGGNLSEILGTVTNTIRERASLQREIRVLTSRQRLTGNLIAILPVGVAAAFIFLSPTAGKLLLHSTAGHFALGIAIGFELLGLWLIRRLGKIEV